MYPYHKIPTIYKRDPDNNHKTLLEGVFASPELEYLQYNIWNFTEKVDGTNIRVIWTEDEQVIFKGRTDRAEIPPFLLHKLEILFPQKKFRENNIPTKTCLYGEGYGARIQKGGGYYIKNDVSFILFDVWINGFWLSRENVEDIGEKLNISVVPNVGFGNIKDAVNLVQGGFESHLRETPPEGIVLRPTTEIFNHKGKRIIAKLKLKDFK